MSVSSAVRDPRAFVGGKYNRLKQLLLDPEGFFEEKAISDRLWTEAGFVLVIGLVGFAGMYYLTQDLMSHFVTNNVDLTDDTFLISDDKALQMWTYSARGVIGAVLLWLGLSVAFHALSWLYSDRGSLFRITKYTAWAMTPILFYNLLKSAAIVYVTVTQDLIDPVADEQEIANNVVAAPQGEATTYLFDLAYEEPVVYGAMAVGLVFVVWTGYLSAYAIAEVRDIDVSDAYKAVAVPVAVYALYVLNQILGHAGVL